MRQSQINRRAYNGLRSLFLTYLSALPSHRVRAQVLRRALGANIAPSARVYRWREIRNPSLLTVGPGTQVGTSCTLDARNGITLGKNVNLSSEVAIWTLQHDYSDPGFGTKGGAVRVGDRAWISFRAILLPGVTIGEGAVVAAGAVVAKDVAPWTVVAGIPAKVVGSRNPNQHYDWTKEDRSVWFI